MFGPYTGFGFCTVQLLCDQLAADEKDHGGCIIAFTCIAHCFCLCFREGACHLVYLVLSITPAFFRRYAVAKTFLLFPEEFISQNVLAPKRDDACFTLLRKIRIHLLSKSKKPDDPNSEDTSGSVRISLLCSILPAW